MLSMLSHQDEAAPATVYFISDISPESLVKACQALGVELPGTVGGSCASTALHLQLAKDHGFTDIAEVDILDAEDSMEIPIEGGKRLSVDYVGGHFTNYDSFLVLSHFKGHAMSCCCRRWGSCRFP